MDATKSVFARMTPVTGFATFAVWTGVLVAAGLSIAAIVLTLYPARRPMLLINDSPEDTILFYLLQNTEAWTRWIQDDALAYASASMWTYMHRHSLGVMADGSDMPDDLTIALASGVQAGDWVQVTNAGKVYYLRSGAEGEATDTTAGQGRPDGTGADEPTGSGWVLDTRPEVQPQSYRDLFTRKYSTVQAISNYTVLGKWRWPHMHWHTLPKKLIRPGRTYAFSAAQKPNLG